MSPYGDFAAQPYVQELAQLYDIAVPDWPGEIDFYTQLIRSTTQSAKPSVLEIACGTGRVAIQIAEQGARVVGIDLSEEMLTFAHAKSENIPNVQFVLADMRSFELNRRFELAIVPAYSFQLLLSPFDQAACLEKIAQHLDSGGILVLHLEKHPPSWLASLPTNSFTPFERVGETVHPVSGERIRVSYAWSYRPDTRHVCVMTRYEAIDHSGSVMSQTSRGPLRMYRTLSSQLEAQLAEAGFEVRAIYGDFYQRAHNARSEEAIWVARKH